MKPHTVTALVFAFVFGLGLAHGQQPAAIEIGGDVRTSLRLTAEDLAAMPRATVTTAEGGRSTQYEGVWVHDILRRAGVPQGEAMRGKALSSYVLCTAQDGYQVLYSLAELDPEFQDSTVLLADRADGKPLPPTSGNFRMVAPKDKRGARSIRMLQRIDVIQVRK